MEEIVLGVKVNTGDGKRSVADLRNEMKTLTEEVNNTERGTDAYAKAIQRLGETKAELKDLREDIAALDPDAKAKAFIGLGQTMVAGFTAAQGAAALFGSENEDIQKGILKMQAAIGVLHGIQAAADAKDQVARLKIIALRQLEIIESKKQLVVTEGMTVAQRVLNAVMAANPAALVAGAVVALTTAVVAFTVASKNNSEEIKRNNELLKEGELARNNYKSAGDDIEFQLELIGKNLTEFNIKELSLEHETRKEIKKIRDEYKKKTLDGIYKSSAEQEIAYQNLMSNEILLWDIHFDKLELMRAQENERTKLDNQKRADENLAALKAQMAKEAELRDRAYWDNIAKLEEAERQNAELSRQRELEEYALSHQMMMENTQQFNADQQQEDLFSMEALTASWEEHDSKRLENAQFTGMTMYEAAKATNASLLSLTDLAVKNQDKAFKIKKAIAIADLAVDTAKAISGAIAQAQSVPFPGNIAAVAVGVATVLANVLKARQILQSANPGSGGGSISGGAVSAPSPNVQRIQTGGGDTATTTRLGQEGSSKPVQEIKVSVLESEITSTQNRVKVIEARSTF